MALSRHQSKIKDQNRLKTFIPIESMHRNGYCRREESPCSKFGDTNECDEEVVVGGVAAAVDAQSHDESDREKSTREKYPLAE